MTTLRIHDTQNRHIIVHTVPWDARRTSEDYEVLDRMYKDDARALYDLLYKEVPGGTVDELTRLLNERTEDEDESS
jgi:hypothetical protein